MASIDEAIKQEALRYIKERKGYKRIIANIIKKYRSLGKIGGYIILEHLSLEEVQILSPLDYTLCINGKCKVKAEKFVQHFCSGKFEQVDFVDLLSKYTKEELVSHKVQRNRVVCVRENWFETVKQFFKITLTKAWLEETLKNKVQAYNLLLQCYNEDKEKLQEILVSIDQTMRLLTEETGGAIPLPLLASIVTRDAHYFDLNTTAGRLLIYRLAYEQNTAYPEQLEMLNELLSRANIIRDEVSNNTLCFGILGVVEEKMKPWEVFWEIGEPLQLSLYNVKDCTAIKTKNNKVYIVENPTVFIQLVEKLSSPYTGIICTNGQMNTCSYKILDLLYQSNTTFYYNGDFDPEGLVIADKLKVRYGEKLHLWHYTLEDYHHIKGKVDISNRLKQLQQLQTPELKLLGEEINKYGVSGHQELLIDILGNEV